MPLLKAKAKVEYVRVSLRQDARTIERMDRFAEYLNRTRDDIAQELFEMAMDSDKGFAEFEGREVKARGRKPVTKKAGAE